MANVLDKINLFDTPKFKIVFNSPEREGFIRVVCDFRNIVPAKDNKEIIELIFGSKVEFKNFYPTHIVLMSCFIDELKLKGYLIKLSILNQELSDYLFDQVKINTYWGKEKVHHIDSPVIADLNIWRISENMKDFYSISVHDYFKRSYFDGLDLSAFKNSLNELYCNVFDHADANGNSFSFIRFDKSAGKINVAVCDFGEGIAKTLRNKYPNFKNDCEALENSIKIGISANSQKHNKGFGLDNVASTLQKGDTMRIVSNQALLRIIDEKTNIKLYPFDDFDFKGTLLYFEISITSFEKEEFFDVFTF